jgi:hypothetical protein
MLVLDSGAVTKLATRNRQTAAVVTVLRREGLWPPLVPSAVLVETLTGRSGPDANTNRLLATCDIVGELSESTARRAARLRFLARRGSAVDALVVALAEPSGSVLTGDLKDLAALAAHSAGVTVERI